MATEATIDKGKRRFLVTATSVVGGIGAVAVATPFVMSFWPSERAKAAGAPVEVDISQARARPEDHRRMARQAGAGSCAARRRCSSAAQERRPPRRSRSPRSPQQPDVREERVPLDQARGLVADRRLHAPGLLAAAQEGRRRRADMGADWPGGFYCPCHGSKFDLAGRVFKGSPAPDEPRRAAAPLRDATPRRDRRRHEGSLTWPSNKPPSLARPFNWVYLGRRSASRWSALWKAQLVRVLRAEELQLLVLLRLARAARAGDPDRLGHLPDDELQARRGARLRLGRVHHARRAGRLAHPLHPLDRRLGVLHRASTCTCSAACCTARYRKPRELVWIFGVLIYLTLMAEAFFGYLLPWGQMSYWGAQVIVNLFGTDPVHRRPTSRSGSAATTSSPTRR